MKKLYNLYGRLMVILLSTIIGLGMLFMTWYQQVGRTILAMQNQILLAILLALLILGITFVLCLWLLGWDVKPAHWRVLESQGKHWDFVRKNIRIFNALLIVLGSYVLYSLAVDLLMGAPLTEMLKYSFFRKSISLSYLPIFWDQNFPILYTGFYIGLGLSFLFTLVFYKGAQSRSWIDSRIERD